MRYLDKIALHPIFLSFTLLGFLAACSDDEQPSMDPMPSNTVVDVAMENQDFSILANAIGEAGLVEPLSADGPFTVFAPNNDAFQAFLDVNNLQVTDLLNSPDLGAILQYHVVSGEVPSSAVESGSVNALNGELFYISIDPEGSIWINGSAQVISADINASNGLIHALNNVIISPSQNIAEIAVGLTESEEPEFTQLVGALLRADLVDTFSGGAEDDFTVFAPTDAAFEALYETLGVSGYDDIDEDVLTQVLTYHVIGTREFSQDLRDNMELETLLEGSNLEVDLGNLRIGNGGLIANMLNIHATNGVIHVVDEVLLPGREEVSATISLVNEGFSAYLVTELEGEGATVNLNEENAEIELEIGRRYTFRNTVSSNHPLEFRNGDGDVLLAQGSEEGSFENNIAVNFTRDGDEDVTFTLTPALAAEIAVYRCTPHASMEGLITVVE